MKPDIHRLLDLQYLLLAFNNVDRVVHRKHKENIVFENDTEHSYNLAMTAWFLSQWFPELNKDLILRYALVHDIVEVHAGDTFSYGTAEELASKADREEKALEQLREEWADFSDLTSTITVYESLENNEAKFVYALDKIMPILVIFIHEGYSWKKHNITAELLYKSKIDKVAKSPEILPYFHELYELLLEHPEIIAKR